MNQTAANAAENGVTEDKLAKNEYLTFLLGNEEYGVEILRVQEVKGWEGVRTIPNLPQFIKGVINLRGDIVPIIDLRERFNLTDTDYDKPKVVIVLRVNGDKGEQIMGITVDAVSEVYAFGSEQLKPPPELGSAAGINCVRNIATAGDKTIILLDVDELLYRDLSNFQPTQTTENKNKQKSAPADAGTTRSTLNPDLIESSFKAIADQGEEIVSRFYAELFKRYPDVKPLFANVPISEQKKKLLASLQLVVDNVRKPEKLTETLKILGAKHQAYGAIEAHYDAVAEVLLDVLKEYAGRQWTREVADAWSTALVTIKNAMLSAYDTQLSENEIEQIETSFAALADQGDEIVARFYTQLFEQYPAVKPLFANVTVQDQQKKLLAALALVVNNLRKPDVLKDALQKLGAKHQAYGAEDAHYDAVAGVLLGVLQTVAGDLWTDELGATWQKALLIVKSVMLDAYA